MAGYGNLSENIYVNIQDLWILHKYMSDAARPRNFDAVSLFALVLLQLGTSTGQWSRTGRMTLLTNSLKIRFF